ncbi:MAG: hypothetical protein ACFFCV_17050 [Promethearchaeota archaeon]
MKKVLYIFLCSAIFSTVLSFIFPILSFASIPSQFTDHFWIWGYRYIPFIDGINILDIPQKIISLFYVLLIIFLLRSFYVLRRNPDSLDDISQKWQKWGILSLILYSLWIMSSFILGALNFVYPYGYIINFSFIFPILSGLLLILTRTYYCRF